MGQGATAGQRLTKLKKQGSKAAGSAATTSGQYVASSGRASSSPTTTPTPPPAALPGCSGFLAMIVALIRRLLGGSSRDSAVGFSANARAQQSPFETAGYIPEEAARISEDTRARVRALIERINSANADTGTLPSSGEMLELARTLHTERVYGLAIDLAAQAPYLVPAEAAPIEYFQARRESHLLLYSIYLDRGQLDHAEYHEAEYFRFDAGMTVIG